MIIKVRCFSDCMRTLMNFTLIRVPEAHKHEFQGSVRNNAGIGSGISNDTDHTYSSCALQDWFGGKGGRGDGQREINGGHNRIRPFRGRFAACSSRFSRRAQYQR